MNPLASVTIKTLTITAEDNPVATAEFDPGLVELAIESVEREGGGYQRAFFIFCGFV